MDQDKLIERLKELIEDMSFDYDRFSGAGKMTYDEICTIIGQLTR